MVETNRTELMSYIAFDEQDVANLRVLGLHAHALIPPTVDRFYREILAHPGTRAVLGDDPGRINRLRQSLAHWLRGLFAGNYDADYWIARAQVGRAHVRVGLGQQYMFAGMQVIWEELERGVRQLPLPDATPKLVSLHKLVMLELAVMLESYKDSYSEQIRQVERDAVQVRLTEAEHLAKIGQLAASLAHEIKNPLAGISGAIQVMRESMKPDQPHRPVLDEILRQIHRLDGTVKDLLVYARPKPPRFRQGSLDQTIARALSALRQQPEMQRVRLDYVNSQKLPPLELDENQIEQLLVNLLLNAAQASSPGGLIRLITTAHADGVRLTVEDRGHGMDAEVRRRAMEPFFTTKAKGTGLGLPICRKIVETHGGRIAIRSTPGEGTEVTVELPWQPPASGGSPDDDSRAAG